MIIPRFDAAAAWAAVPADQQAEIGALALALVVTWNGEDAHPGDGNLFGRLHQSAEVEISDRLLTIVQDLLPAVIMADPVPVPTILGPICEVCGHTAFDAIFDDHDDTRCSGHKGGGI